MTMHKINCVDMREDTEKLAIWHVASHIVCKLAELETIHLLYSGSSHTSLQQSQKATLDNNWKPVTKPPVKVHNYPLL